MSFTLGFGWAGYFLDRDCRIVLFEDSFDVSYQFVHVEVDALGGVAVG